MLASVTFIILDTAHSQQRDHNACLLCEYSYHQQQRIHLLCQSQSHQDSLNQQLWSFKNHAFIPHTNDETIFLNAPVVLISIGANANINSDLIINLSNSPVANAHQHRSIIELVMTSQDDKTLRRQHYKHYQQLKMSVKSDKMQIA